MKYRYNAKWNRALQNADHYFKGKHKNVRRFNKWMNAAWKYRDLAIKNGEMNGVSLYDCIDPTFECGGEMEFNECPDMDNEMNYVYGNSNTIFRNMPDEY